MADVDNCAASPSARTTTRTRSIMIYIRETAGRDSIYVVTSAGVCVSASASIRPMLVWQAAIVHRGSMRCDQQSIHTPHIHTQSELTVGQPTPSVPIVSLTQ